MTERRLMPIQAMKIIVNKSAKSVLRPELWPTWPSVHKPVMLDSLSQSCTPGSLCIWSSSSGECHR